MNIDTESKRHWNTLKTAAELRKAFVDGFGNDEFQLATTLTFSRHIDKATAERTLDQFVARLSKLLYGPYWHKKGHKIRFVAVPEREGENLHYHLAIHIPVEHLHFRYEHHWFLRDEPLWHDLIQTIWQSIKTNIKTHINQSDKIVKFTNTAETNAIYDLRGWLIYISKQWEYYTYNTGHELNFILSR